MKHCVFVLAILGFALSSPAAAQTYHFSAYLFDGKEIFKPAAKGDGNPDVCELLFDASYESGRSSSIPKNATVFPLSSDHVKRGMILLVFPSVTAITKHFECDTPGITYWRRGLSEVDLLKIIVEVIKKR